MFSCSNLYYIGTPLPSHSAAEQVFILLCRSWSCPWSLPLTKALSIFNTLGTVIVFGFTLTLPFYRCLNREVFCVNNTKETNQGKEEEETQTTEEYLASASHKTCDRKWLLNNTPFQLKACEKQPTAPLLPQQHFWSSESVVPKADRPRTHKVTAFPQEQWVFTHLQAQRGQTGFDSSR